MRNREYHELDLSESFTIHLGSQIRTMYNLRLEAGNIDQLFFRNLDPAQELAIRAQTCSSIYSQKLCGVIQLIQAEEFYDNCSGTSNSGINES